MTNISQTKLSLIINGHVAATRDEIDALGRVLGPEAVQICDGECRQGAEYVESQRSTQDDSVRVKEDSRSATSVYPLGSVSVDDVD